MIDPLVMKGVIENPALKPAAEEARTAWNEPREHSKALVLSGLTQFEVGSNPCCGSDGGGNGAVLFFGQLDRLSHSLFGEGFPANPKMKVNTPECPGRILILLAADADLHRGDRHAFFIEYLDHIDRAAGCDGDQQ